jgi:hypothetical protein
LGGLFTANFFSQCTQAHADELIDLRVSNHFACLATGSNLIHMYHHVDGPSADTTLITPQAEALRMVNRVMRNNLLPSSAYAVTDNPEVDLFFMGEDALGNPILDSTLSAALKIFVSETREDESGAVPGSQGSLGRIDILVLNNDDNAPHEVTLHLPCDGGHSGCRLLARARHPVRKRRQLGIFGACVRDDHAAPSVFGGCLGLSVRWRH